MDRPLYWAWGRRLMGTGIGMQLGAPGAFWRVVPKNPGNDWVTEKATELGRTFGDEDIAYYTSRSLLGDALHAAGGIEYTVSRIEGLAETIQQYADDNAVTASGDVPLSLVTADVECAYLEYANLLTWIRTLGDRVRSPDPRSHATLGLLPALADGALRGVVAKAYDKFRNDPLIANEAFLANFGLHLHGLPGGGSPTASVTDDGRARLLIPDKPTDRVYLFDQFTYSESREMLEFAQAVLARAASFIDELLSAFEAATDAWMRARGDE